MRVFDRRELLRVAGIALPGLVARPAARAGGPGFGRAKSVVLVYCNGGQSQLEMWDPKPGAPLEVRGEFGSIATAVPGVRFGEHLPRLARLADRFTLVRSVSHDDLDHGSATYFALTGRPHPIKSSNPPPSVSDYPTYGALVKRLGLAASAFEAAIHVNGPALVPFEPGPGQDGGFLGRSFEPIGVGEGRVDIASTSPADLPATRVDGRRSLLAAIESGGPAWDAPRPWVDFDGIRGRAFDLADDPACREAFDLEREPAKVREAYGEFRSGRALLQARRLVEAGVPWITVFWNHSGRGQDNRPEETDEYGWDTHNDIFEALRDRLLPRFDLSFSSFLLDLDERGLLDSTLVVCMGEFGRAPRVAIEKNFAGTSAGRKHWANVYSVVVAGAGVGRGAVVGASDRLAAYPLEGRVGPADLAATMFAALGIDPAAEVVDPLGRPFALTTGRPVAGLYESA